MQRDERTVEAVELQGAGGLREAEGFYEAILETDPADAHALHLLGSAASQSVRLGRALAHVRRAALRPQFGGSLAPDLAAVVQRATVNV